MAAWILSTFLRVSGSEQLAGIPRLHVLPAELQQDRTEAEPNILWPLHGNTTASRSLGQSHSLAALMLSHLV